MLFSSLPKNKQTKILKARKDKTFESLKKFYVSYYFQTKYSKMHKDFFKKHGITYKDIEAFVNKISNPVQSKVKKFKSEFKKVKNNELFIIE